MKFDILCSGIYLRPRDGGGGGATHRENQIIMKLDIKWPVGDTNHNPNRSYYHRTYAKFKKLFDIQLVFSE